jgi:hypothetical protein
MLTLLDPSQSLQKPDELVVLLVLGVELQPRQQFPPHDRAVDWDSFGSNKILAEVDDSVDLCL